MAKQPPATIEKATSKTREEIIKEAKRLEEGLLYSSKGHFAASHYWGRFHLWVGIPMVVLSAVSGATALSQFDPRHVIAGILAIIVTVLSALATFLNPNERVRAHLNAGNNYDSLMNKLRLFWAIDCWGEESDQALTERLRYFGERKDHLNQTSPQVPRWAYAIAKRGIMDGEGSYAVDEQKGRGKS